MGEFLSTPIKDKQSEENENQFVSDFSNSSADTAQLECRAGVKGWRTPTSPTLL